MTLLTPELTPQDTAHHVMFCLLGPFSVHLDGVPVRQPLTGPAQHLLIFLLLQSGRRHRRDVLMDQVWPDDAPPSRAAFNTALWRVRRFVGTLPGVTLDVLPDALRLQLGGRAVVDAGALAKAASDPEPDSDQLQRAVNRWRGPLAEGLTQVWALVEREKSHNDYIHALGSLMRNAGTNGQLERALDYGQRILTEDPFRESVHAEVLWLLVLTGQRARAIRQHQGFCDLLMDELSIKPMAETTALFTYIVKGLEESPRTPADEKITGGDAVPTQSYLGYLDAVARSRAKIFEALRAMHPNL